MKNKKILIISNQANCGKDEVAKILQKNFGFKYGSSSEYALNIFLLDILWKEYGVKFDTVEEAMEAKQNDDALRQIFHEEIKLFNSEDKARLAKIIMRDNDIYVGMRAVDELNECVRQGVFDIVVGVTREGVEEESRKSNNIVLDRDCDLVIPNNGTLEELEVIVGNVAKACLIR